MSPVPLLLLPILHSCLLLEAVLCWNKGSSGSVYILLVGLREIGTEAEITFLAGCCSSLSHSPLTTLSNMWLLLQ